MSSSRRNRSATAGLDSPTRLACFYLAIDKLPLSTVGAIEFLGTVLLAVAGTRTRRNIAALALSTTGVALVTAIRLGGQPLGFALAFANCLLFMLYVVLGHRIASLRPREGANQPGGIDPARSCFASSPRRRTSRASRW